jgi:hypothetical protein
MDPAQYKPVRHEHTSCQIRPATRKKHKSIYFKPAVPPCGLCCRSGQPRHLLPMKSILPTDSRRVILILVAYRVARLPPLEIDRPPDYRQVRRVGGATVVEEDLA